MLRKNNVKAFFFPKFSAFFASVTIFAAEQIFQSCVKKEINVHIGRIHAIEQYALVHKTGKFPKIDWFSKIESTARAGQSFRAQACINKAIREERLDGAIWDHEIQQLAGIAECTKLRDIDSILNHINNSKIVRIHAAVVSVEEWAQRLQELERIRAMRNASTEE